MANELEISIYDRDKRAGCKEVLALCGEYSVTMTGDWPVDPETGKKRDGWIGLMRLRPPHGVLPRTYDGPGPIPFGPIKLGEAYLVKEAPEGSAELSMKDANLVRDFLAYYPVEAVVPLRAVFWTTDGEKVDLAGTGDLLVKVVEPFGSLHDGAEDFDLFRGAAGEPGAKGDVGKSAYEVAVENGFQGTKAEWLASLVGNSALGYVPDYDDGTKYHKIVAKIVDGECVVVVTNETVDEADVSVGEMTARAEAAAAAAEQSAEDAITKVDEAVEAAKTAAAEEAEPYAQASEAYAKGTVDGMAVQEGEAGYHDNSKYYSEQSSASASASAGSASDSEAYAVGKRGGTDVESTDPAYENNAKHYAEQAADSASQAADAARSIPTGVSVLAADETATGDKTFSGDVEFSGAVTANAGIQASGNVSLENAASVTVPTVMQQDVEEPIPDTSVSDDTAASTKFVQAMAEKATNDAITAVGDVGLMIQVVEVTQDIASLGAKQTAIITTALDSQVVPQGYTPIGVVGHFANSGFLLIMTHRVLSVQGGAPNLDTRVYNYGTSTLTSRVITSYVLCIRQEEEEES